MSQQDLRGRIVSGFVWMLSGTLVQNLMQFVSLVVLARLLMPVQFGVVAAAMVVIGFLTIFAELGVGPALVQKMELEASDIATGNTLSLILSVTLGALVWMAAHAVAAFFAIDDLANVLRALAIMLPVAALSVVGQALLQRGMRFKHWALITALAYLVAYAGVGIPLAYLGFGVWALVGAYLAQSAALAGFVWWLLPEIRHFGFSLPSARRLLSFGAGHSIARTANYMALQGDNLIVGRVLGVEALGIYGRAYQLMEFPAKIFGSVLDKVLFSGMARIQQDEERLARVYLRAVSIIAMISLPLTAVLILLAEQIILVLLGPQWVAVILPFQILALCMTFRMSYKISDSLVRAKGAEYRRAWRQIVYAVLVISFAWFGSRWGIVGVAAGITIAVTVNFLLMLALAHRLIRFDLMAVARAHARHGVVAVWVGVMIVIVKQAMPSHAGVLTVLLLGLLGAGVALAILGVVCRRILGPEFDYLMDLILSARK